MSTNTSKVRTGKLEG